MLGTYLSLIFAIVLVISLYSLSIRLQFFSVKSAPGRYSFFTGSALLVLGTLWTSLRLLPEYSDWFIQSAYTLIDIFHLVVIVCGLSFSIRGLTRLFESKNELQAEIDYRYQKLGILENLQRHAREPYQFLELLNLAVKEIASSFPECSGVVFLTGRNRKQFVLATSIGLTTQETAYLEYLPFGENVVSQSVETGEPLLSGKFIFQDEKDNTKESRFNSVLVLPLISGMDRIGAILLLSAVEKTFSHQDVRVLAPVGEWLAEKIKSARATRELSAVRKEKDNQSESFTDLTGRVQSAVKAVGGVDSLNNIALVLKGMADSESVYIVQSADSNLDILAGTEPLLDIGEQFTEAIISSIRRSKISVVNQNAEDEQGRSYTKYSTLIYPLSESTFGYALLMRRQSIPFSLNNVELKIISIVSRIIAQEINRIEKSSFEITHRLGFDKIVQLLRLSQRLSFSDDPGFLARHTSSIFPPDSVVLTFTVGESTLFLADVFGDIDLGESEFEISLDEGIIGRASEKRAAVSILGKSEFEKRIAEFSDKGRALFEHLIDRTFIPGLTVITPIMSADVVIGIVVFMFRSVPIGEQREFERLITLTAGLYSLRMTVASVSNENITETVSNKVANITNAINNNLSAVIGNAEILMTKDGLDNSIRSQIQSIMNEAEVAATEVRKLISDSDDNTKEQIEESELASLNEIARMSLRRSHVSENLYMLAGRAREIELKLEEIDGCKFSTKQTQELFSGAISRFASMADDEDIITVSTYVEDEYLYLDISRHRRNFPPVESVSTFGNYQIPEEALKSRPGDMYLKELAATNGTFAYDRFSTAPSYLSFKFPLTKTTQVGSHREFVEILAVDDQPVILELISAMCQTMGYEVTTANSGAEALEIARNRNFNVILTDLAMPGMSGLELAKKLRSSHSDTPIILITGWEATISETELQESGITEILYKPFRIEQLTNLVKSAATRQSV